MEHVNDFSYLVGTVVAFVLLTLLVSALDRAGRADGE